MDNKITSVIENKEDDIKFKKYMTELKSQLKLKELPLTMRDALSTLERHLMIEIVGSKRKSIRFEDIFQLEQDPIYKNDYANCLIKYGLTDDHIDLMLIIRKYNVNNKKI